MTAKELISFFGGVAAAARALGVKDPSVSQWKATGVVPELRQYQAEIASGGRLKAEKPARRASSQIDPSQEAA